LSFEKLHQAYGYVLYRTQVTNARSGILSIKELRDYGIVFVNGKRQGTLNRMKKQDSLPIQIPSGKATIDILVENLGRINFGPNLLKNEKGITDKVLLNGNALTGWQMFSLPMKTVGQLPLNNQSKPGVPAIKRAAFTLEERGDTYLDMRKWGKGCVWINGHHLGRYWQIGPQQTLYVPAEWLKKGKNEITVFELNKPEALTISSLEKPVLNELK
jgi:beta-galactosidase